MPSGGVKSSGQASGSRLSDVASNASTSPSFVTRRTEVWDSPEIKKLADEQTVRVFGHAVVENLIERNLFGVTLLMSDGEEEELVGHASFTHYPNHEREFGNAFDSGDWERYVHAHFEHVIQKGMPSAQKSGEVDRRPRPKSSVRALQIDRATALNSMYLHYFVARPDIEAEALREAITSLFASVPEAYFLFLLVPLDVSIPSFFRETFTQLDVKHSVKRVPDFNLFVTSRDPFVRALYIRPAKVEDNDDLVPIFAKQNDVLQKTYGNFFVAELIEAQNENMQCFVAEAGGMAVGFMSVSKQVELDLLNRCFQLEHMHGLRKPHPEDMLEGPPPPLSPSNASSRRSSAAPSKPSSAVAGGRGSPGARDSPRSSASASLPQSRATSATTKQGEEDAAASAEGSAAPTARSDEGEGQLQVNVKLAELAAEGQGLPEGGAPAPEGGARTEGSPTSPSGEAKKTERQPVRTAPLDPRHAHRRRQFVPKFAGESNALSVQLFCIDEKWQARAADFLGAVFERFTDREFLVITIPHMVPEFKLLQSFVRVTPRTDSIFPHELYIFHRAGLLKSFKVRPALRADHANIERLVHMLHMGDRVLDDLLGFYATSRTKEGKELQAVVAEAAGGQVVGVAIMREENEIEYLRAHYDLERFIYFAHHRVGEHARLIHFLLNPVFQHLAKYFLKEILRLGHKTCLYYRLYPPQTPEQILKETSLVTCLGELVPVRIRRKIIYPPAQSARDPNGLPEVNLPTKQLLAAQPPFALYHLNYKLITEPKLSINPRIVVVGASEVGLSFLETLAFCPYLKFNNVTLISPHGLPGELPVDPFAVNMRARSADFPPERLVSLALSTWVNVVYGKLTDIHREKKELVVNGRHRVPYDHLVLCTGTQYTVPRALQQVSQPSASELKPANGTHKELFKPRVRKVPVPDNVLLLNDEFDVLRSLNFFESLFSRNPNASILVYGHTLDAYCTINQLVNLAAHLGFPERSWSITFVKTDRPDPVLATKEVTDAVAHQLANAGVAIFNGYTLTNLELSASENGKSGAGRVRKVTFTNKEREIFELETDAIVMYAEKNVDLDAFKAVNDACLVFDGRLVIDAQFHTNDVCIRAAGPLTKFQRKYYSDALTHSSFNSAAVGRELARTILALFDPTRTEAEREKREFDLLPLLPHFKDPKMQLALLPGNLHYLHVRKPEVFIAKSDQQLLQRRAGPTRDLSTGNPLGKPPYFRIFVNQNRSIEEVTCLAKKEQPFTNFISLFGLHEKLLNNMTKRFDEGLIKDFYQYLSEPWALAIFHDRFRALHEEIRQLFNTPQPLPEIAGSDRGDQETEDRQSNGSFEAAARKLLEEDLMLTEGQRRDLHGLLESRGLKRAVEQRLLSFLHFHDYQLPMYARPQML